MDRRSAEHDDVELGDLEDDAFIPGGNTSKPKTWLASVSSRLCPPRLLNFLLGLSRIQLVVITVIIGVTLLVWLGWLHSAPASVPVESIALAKKLAEDLSDSKIPTYVLQYAPLVFLDKGEAYYPSDMSTHVASTRPYINFTIVTGYPDPLTLVNLNALNEMGGEDIFLTSISSVVKLPKYLNGQKPSPTTLKTEGAVSCAVIVVQKGDNTVDAFYMYFYTMNAGPTVLGYQLGNHLGDWEHSMIRFKDNKPTAIWYSQHEYGEAFKWEAVQKMGQRPLVYSAKGSHANYASADSIDLHKIDESIPAHIAYDHTSRGSLWDPTLSAYYYEYSIESSKFTPAIEGTPVNYLYSKVRWGDQEYPDDAEGQESFHGFHKWTGGPQGPLFKHLDRENVCLPKRPECVLKEEVD